MVGEASKGAHKATIMVAQWDRREYGFSPLRSPLGRNCQKKKKGAPVASPGRRGREKKTCYGCSATRCKESQRKRSFAHHFDRGSTGPEQSHMGPQKRRQGRRHTDRQSRFGDRSDGSPGNQMLVLTGPVMDGEDDVHD